MRNLTPIAIIGISCRLPRANDPTAFWQLLSSNGSAIREVPGERWNIEYFDSGKPGPGRINSRSGGFLDDVEGFDAGFFDGEVPELLCPVEGAGFLPLHRIERGGFHRHRRVSFMRRKVPVTV
jgi:beta-ketoacyl synthase-like protein